MSDARSELLESVCEADLLLGTKGPAELCQGSLRAVHWSVIEECFARLTQQLGAEGLAEL